MLASLLSSWQQFLLTLGAGFSLALGRLPNKVRALRPMPHFWWFALLQIPISIAVQHFQLQGDPQVFSGAGLLSDAVITLALLGLATWLCALGKRPVMSYSLATLLLVASLWAEPIAALLYDWTALRFPARAHWVIAGFAAWWWIVVIRTTQFVLPETASWARIWAASILAGGILWLRFAGVVPLPRYVELDDNQLNAWEAALPVPRLAFDPEALMYQQPALLRRQLGFVQRSDANQAELYVIALAGDGETQAFINEAAYTAKLFEDRFLTRSKTLVLGNHPNTTALYPLATMTNLRMALQDFRGKMGPEDALFLFMTSHGSPQFEFLIDLGPLALNQITPQSLQAALNDAHQNRVIALISACFSGGYLDALQSPDRIIMTAARSDRSSFGCAPDSQLTYFGRAYLVEALNQTHDVIKAFEIAERRIEQLERQQELLPSMPQIRIGRGARDWLNDWQRTITPGDPVPFFVPKQLKPP